jgi:hypothetical protein
MPRAPQRHAAVHAGRQNGHTTHSQGSPGSQWLSRQPSTTTEGTHAAEYEVRTRFLGARWHSRGLRSTGLSPSLNGSGLVEKAPRVTSWRVCGGSYAPRAPQRRVRCTQAALTTGHTTALAPQAARGSYDGIPLLLNACAGTHAADQQRTCAAIAICSQRLFCSSAKRKAWTCFSWKLLPSRTFCSPMGAGLPVAAVAARRALIHAPVMLWSTWRATRHEGAAQGRASCAQ